MRIPPVNHSGEPSSNPGRFYLPSLIYLGRPGPSLYNPVSADQNYGGMYNPIPYSQSANCLGSLDHFSDIWFEPDQSNTRYQMNTQMAYPASSIPLVNPFSPGDHGYQANNQALQMLSNNFIMQPPPPQRQTQQNNNPESMATMSVDMIDVLSQSTPDISDGNGRKKRTRRPKQIETKDAKYYERRAKNNESAKRSRENKRQREIQTAEKAKELEHECSRLRAMNEDLSRKWYDIMNCICQSCKNRIAQLDEILIVRQQEHKDG
ncbi:hypothetical protein ACOME3_003527 [Neoechinorhynchus agilis]